MAARLDGATSRYLLQHADDPVDWHPWGPDAFAEAARRDIPVFLSIGYSTCHWCHVMAAESFRDADTAAELNRAFVCVKVDREERPDIDAAYQEAARRLGAGGWPMSIFLTPDGEPFYAGSYWPQQAAGGRPSFRSVLDGVTRAWTTRRGAVRASVQAIAAELALADAARGTGAEDAEAEADRALAAALRLRDREHGGFGTAPKFPHPMAIEWLLHRHARTGDPEALDAAVGALTAMARGAIHDLVDGGFARYCTDAAWRTPHFEKMLGDNALLLPAYAAAAVLADRDDLAAVARSTASFLLTGFRTAEDVFRSAFDADSGGVEGGSSVWTRAELVDTLAGAGLDGEHWAVQLGADAAGEEARPLQLTATDDRVTPLPDALRAALVARQSRRPRPRTDDTVLTDGNALAVRGLVKAGLLLDEPEWIAAGAAAAERLHGRVRDDGRIAHTAVGDGGFLLDHAATALAELELFGATGDTVWFHRALSLAAAADRWFRDERGGWFDTATHELFTRPKTRTDDGMPAGTSVMIEVCLLLAGLTGDLAWRQRAIDAIPGSRAGAQPTRHGWLLRQLEWLSAPQREVAVVGRPGPARDALGRIAQGRPRPGAVTVVADAAADDIPLLAGRTEVDGVAAAYVCEALACRRPVTSVADLGALLS